MIRTQVQLTDEQSRRLEQLAVARGVSKAELVRQAVDLLLQRSALDRSPEELRRRALEVIGAFRSGYHDTAENHDAVLDEIYRE